MKITVNLADELLIAAKKRAAETGSPLRELIEIKLASGLSAAHRLRDLADVLELIRACALEESFSDALPPMARDKYAELWLAAQAADPE